jgi:glycosyltransferase involved in cell wall biosynthesis
VSVITHHARGLAERDGWEVTLVLVRDPDGATWHGYGDSPHVRVRTRDEALQEHYDVAVATWWETTFTLFDIQADRRAYFVQSLEDRFYRHDEAGRLGAALTLDLPVSFITEAQWIADTLAALRPDAPCYVVPNGIDKDVFAPLPSAPVNDSAPLRILIEGSPSSWFKHVHAAIDAAAAMSEPRHVTVVTGDRSGLGDVVADEVLGPLNQTDLADAYERSDVVLKLSSVEGMFGPPLEGFHRGATCVVTPVTGYDEYIEHGYNGLVTDWDDLRGTARQLDLLARDRELLARLRTNALETARAWPSWDQTTPLMATALDTIVREPQPGASAGTARMLADLRAGLETYDAHLRERVDYARRALRFERRIKRVVAMRPVQWLLALRRFRIVRIAARPLRPLTGRLRRLAQ